MPNDKKTKVHCIQCSRETNHETLAEHVISGEDEDNGIQWRVVHSIIKCCGCDEITFMKVSGSSEDFDPETGEYYHSTSLYPDRASGRSMLSSEHEFPQRVRAIYREVIGAMNSSSSLLAAIGLRALIEAICVAEKTKGNNLQDRIEQLAKDGHLSANQATMLHSHRFLGNTAAHEITAPKPKELVAALDIAETLLKTIYVLPSLGDSITTGKKP
jgi:hypothetical protein